ncbi:MAG: HU family DNA-binding protein [Candidatus Scalindua sp.]|nr:HU family DNA-binding protein [Candidatus Scalindua sp.]
MFLDKIVQELSHGNRIELRDFGVFEVKQRAARKARILEQETKHLYRQKKS